MQQLKRRYHSIIACLLAFVITFGMTAGGEKAVVSAASHLGVPALAVVSRTSSSVNLKLSKVDGATGYRVYRATTKSGTYTKIGTTKKLTYTDTKTSSRTAYYYKVRAYKSTSNGNIYGKYSAIYGVKANLAKPANISAKQAKGDIKLTWNKVTGADKYLIYRATSKNGSYTHVKSVKDNSYIDNSVKAGSTYYYKVRAYAVKSNVKYFSSYSEMVSAKAVKYTYQQAVVDLINKERKKEGLSPLKNSSKLQGAAYQRAKEIRTLFSHTRPNGETCFTVLGEHGISYMVAGENIAYGQRTPEDVMYAWMHSEGHRNNIMSKNFGTVGIGYYVVDGIPYWVQLFTN